MKKGMMHIDWIIAIAIFILYISFFFTLLKPSFKSELQGDMLLSIIEENFKSTIYWNLTKNSLFVDCVQNCAGLQDLCLDVYPFTWQENNLRLFDNTQQLGFTFSQDCGPDDDLTFSHNINDGMNVFLLVYDASHSYINPGWNCANPDPFNPGDCLFFDTKNYNYSYGIVERVYGISEDKLNALKLTSYNEIKSLWNYPANNDFSIILYDQDRNILFYYNNLTYPKDVYVREWADRILYQDTTTKQIIVNLKAIYE